MDATPSLVGQPVHAFRLVGKFIEDARATAQSHSDLLRLPEPPLMERFLLADVEIKVDTFPFTRYGLLHGEVLSISQDAISRDKPADKQNDKPPGDNVTTSEPKGQELAWRASPSTARRCRWRTSS